MAKDGVKLRGFFRVKIGEKDRNGKLKIVGDSKWCRNTFTSTGINGAILQLWASSAGSQFPLKLSLGTQTNAIVTTQASLSGPGTAANAYVNVNLATTGGASGTFQMSATFDGQYYGSNVGAVAVASASNGSMLSGQTFSGGSSSFSTGQTASVTYQWRVS